jgi:dihydroorotase
MTESITITKPDDWHHHFRDGDVLEDVVKHVGVRFCRAIAMPNTQPPVRNLTDAIAYRDRIVAHIPKNHNLQVLMTIYLTDNTTPEEIEMAKSSGVVYGAKLYPAGATTNSEFGVTKLAKIDACLRTMARVGLPLLVHGEVTDKDVDIFDRERYVNLTNRSFLVDLVTIHTKSNPLSEL